jgi:hypothetical protein
MKEHCPILVECVICLLSPGILRTQCLLQSSSCTRNHAPVAYKPLDLRVERKAPCVALELTARAEHEQLVLAREGRLGRRSGRRFVRERGTDRAGPVPEHEERVLLCIRAFESIRVAARERRRIGFILLCGQRLRGERAGQHVRVRELHACAGPAPVERGAAAKRELDGVPGDEGERDVPEDVLAVYTQHGVP